jgi:hypothetical protein
MEGLDSEDRVNLSACKISSPFNSRIRFNVCAMFYILETHGRRHLWQAAQAASKAA